MTTHSSTSAPGVFGFILNTTRRTVINDELLKISAQYNDMIGIYGLFKENMAKNRQEILPA
jgi:hypothetical protein